MTSTNNIGDKTRKGIVRTAIVLINNDHTVGQIIDILCIVHHEIPSGEIGHVVRESLSVYQSLGQACQAVSRQELRVEYMTDKMTVLELIVMMSEKHLRFINKERLDMLLARGSLGDGPR